MSSFNKVVSNATKPNKSSQQQPPKSKYVEPIIAATHSSDGAVQDILRSLGGRLREPNSVIVFKALIVLHTMIRSGSTDHVLGFLASNSGSSGDVLRLRNVTAQAWDGYTPPANLGYYAQYLDARIRGYKELKHDPVRVQAESNRISNYEGSSGKARKLRQLTVEKGLIREVKQVLRMVDALVQCKLYEDHLEDECTVTALRMMVKDLLVLTQAVNEGVINVLEHYFEMSKVDATEALAVYKAFCKQSDKVVEYLGTARRLHQLLDVPVPNLKHAPVSLVAALEEYLNDPNFEQNRIEYKKNMAVADGAPASAPTSHTSPIAPAPSSSAAPTKPAEPPKPAEPAPAAPAAQGQVSRSIQDFLQSIESENAAMQPQITGYPTHLQANWATQATLPNPFRQSMMMPQGAFPQPQMPGQPFGPSFGQQFGQPNGGMPIFPSHTGGPPPQFLQPQSTGWPPLQTQAASPWAGMQQMSPVAQSNGPAPYGVSGGFSPLQPQTTGGNPFRQSVMFPQSTGMPAFASASSPIQRSGPSALETKPLTAQPTGSKNPFAPPPGSEPRKATTGPSLFELSMQRALGQTPADASAQTTPRDTTSTQPQNNSFMSDLASAFSIGSPQGQTGNGLPDFSGLQISNAQPNASNPTNGFMQPQTTGYAGSSVKPFQPTASFLQPQSPAHADNGLHSPASPSFLQPQQTGFAGSAVKPFKPSSTFGSSLVDNLPGQQNGTTGGSTSPPALQPIQTGYNPFAAMSQPGGQGPVYGNSHSDFMQSLNAR